MRVFSTLAAVASAQLQSSAYNVDDFECNGVGEVDFDGFCTSDPALISAFQDAEEIDDINPLMRRFSLNGDDAQLRTKKRSQRITLLLTKMNLGGNLKRPDGSKIRPKDFKTMVNEYGCHCWPDNNIEHLSGKGKPLDGIDSSCFALKQCHTCINIDWPETCDPVSTKYKAKVNRHEDGTMSITCANTLNKKKTNNGDCKKSLCECDREFSENFVNHFSEWENSLWKLMEKNEYEDNCAKQPSAKSFGASGSSGSPAGVSDSCCGNYPNVKAYNSATHSCVDGEVTL